MPIGQANSSVIRLVEGRRGNAPVRLHLTLRFDYGATVSWVAQLEDKFGVTATCSFLPQCAQPVCPPRTSRAVAPPVQEKIPISDYANTA
jgi:hypothetical protein